MGNSGCLRETWRALTGRPFDSALALVAIGIALALPAAGWLWSAQFAALLQGGAFKAQPQVTLFMSVDAPRATTQETVAKLGALPGVAQTRLLAREETLARMRDAGASGASAVSGTSGGLADALDALPGNPFPDAVVVTPADNTPAALEQLAGTLRAWPEVAHVQVDADWAQRLAALVRLARDGAALLVAFFGSFVLVSFWSALGVLGGRRPACVRMTGGALLGLAGGLLAAGLVAGATLWLRPVSMQLAALYELDFMLALPSALKSACLVGAATLLGGLLAVVRR